MEKMYNDKFKSYPRTFIIGEPGSTTRGIYDEMMTAVAEAGEAGCDAVKFQYLSNPTKLLLQRHMFPNEKAEQNYDLLRWKFDIGQKKWWKDLSSLAQTFNLKLGVTFYLPEDVAYVCSRLEEHLDFIKIASFESEFTPLYDEVTGVDQRMPVFVSTGMLTQEEILCLVEKNEKEYPHTTFRYLHCISAYPTKKHETQFRVLQQRWCDGFSDHTKATLTGALAVAAGARYLEVHYMGNELVGEGTPDEIVSLNKKSLHDYVRMVRSTEEMMGSYLGERKLSDPEIINREYRSHGNYLPF